MINRIEIMDLDLSRKILQTFVLKPKEEILDTADHGESAIFRTDSVPWRIERTNQKDGLQIFQCSIAMHGEPSRTPHGVAVLPDQSMFYLNEPDEIRALWRKAGDDLDPLTLADLLVRFQSESPEHQVLVKGPEDLPEAIPEDSVDRIPGFTYPVTRSGTDGHRVLEFCTRFVSPGENPFSLIAGLNRWVVILADGSDMTWSEIMLVRPRVDRKSNRP